MARILIVDDDPGVRSVLRRMLAREGHEVLEEDNGARALARLVELAPDVVVSDIYMPEMDGIEFLIQLGDAAPDIPVIAISGGGPSGGTHILKDAEELGACATLAKPFTYDEIHEVLGRVLT